MKFRWLMVVAAIGLLFNAVVAQDSGSKAVRITKTSGQITKNPLMIYQGISGDQSLSNTVLGFLKACDWFDIRQSGQVDYFISGEVSGGAFRLSVRTGANLPVFSLRVPYNSQHERKIAKIMVDEVLKRLFKVKMCNSKIAFCAETEPGIKNIFICDIDGNDVEQITNFKTLCVEPCWTPDSKSVVYSMYGRSYIDVVQTMLHPRQSRRLVSYPGLNSSVSVSPNGKYLALVLSLDRQVELYVKDLESDRKIRLTNNIAVEASPSWNPGGGSLCFVSDQSGSPKLFKIDVNSKRLTALPTEGSEAVSPEWNADDVIVYSTRMGNYTLALLNMGNTSPARSGVLIRVGGDWESPSWAPDNRHVVCSRKINGKSTLYLVDSWTGNFRPLLDFRYKQSMPAWSKLN